MKPSNEYIGTSAMLSFWISAIVGYPCAAVNSARGIAPNFELWGYLTVMLCLLLTAYSAIPKPVKLLKNNYLVLHAIAITVYFGFWLVNPRSVQDNAAMLFLFLMFTLGLPLLPFILAFNFHKKSCSSIDSVGQSNRMPKSSFIGDN